VHPQKKSPPVAPDHAQFPSLRPPPTSPPPTPASAIRGRPASTPGSTIRPGRRAPSIEAPPFALPAASLRRLPSASPASDACRTNPGPRDNPDTMTWRRQGVRARVVQPSEIVHSPRQHAASSDGADVISPTAACPRHLAQLTQQLRSATARTHVHLYYDRLDSVCHAHGPGSPFARIRGRRTSGGSSHGGSTRPWRGQKRTVVPRQAPIHWTDRRRIRLEYTASTTSSPPPRSCTPGRREPPRPAPGPVPGPGATLFLHVKPGELERWPTDSGQCWLAGPRLVPDEPALHRGEGFFGPV
jgi:hypothetical protein